MKTQRSLVGVETVFDRLFTREAVIPSENKSYCYFLGSKQQVAIFLDDFMFKRWVDLQDLRRAITGPAKR
jgi:hypothetical protein